MRRTTRLLPPGLTSSKIITTSWRGPSALCRTRWLASSSIVQGDSSFRRSYHQHEHKSSYRGTLLGGAGVVVTGATLLWFTAMNTDDKKKKKKKKYKRFTTESNAPSAQRTEGAAAYSALPDQPQEEYCLHEAPPELRGLWKRASIERPVGNIVDSGQTIVYWIQTPHLFADIRIPTANPDRYALDTILNQRASSGRTTITVPQSHSNKELVKDATLIWHCDQDYHPPTGEQDIGRCELLANGAVLIENSIPPQNYREVWLRIAGPPGTSSQEATPTVYPEIGLQLIGEMRPKKGGRKGELELVPRGGVWIVSGNKFAYVIDRDKSEEGMFGKRVSETRCEKGLGELMQLKGKEWGLADPDTISNGALQFESYFGELDSTGKVNVTTSTRQEREGHTLFENPNDAELVYDKDLGGYVQKLGNGRVIRVWKVVDGEKDFGKNPVCPYLKQLAEEKK